MVVWVDEPAEVEPGPVTAQVPATPPKKTRKVFWIRPKEPERRANNRSDRRSRKEKGKPSERAGRKAKSLTRRAAGHAGR